MDIQSLLNEISDHKVSKRTDKQLAHAETMNLWRHSEENKQQISKRGSVYRIYTDEQVQRVRVMFWEEGKSLQQCLDYLGKGTIQVLQTVLKNKTYVDPNFEWDVTLYTQKTKQQRTRTKKPLSQQQIDILAGMDGKEFCEKYSVSPQHYADSRLYLRKQGYDVPVVKNRPPKKNKGLVD